ncbi:MAG: hypothetical protein AAGL24_19415 [Pseudomonadota bacterium]
MTTLVKTGNMADGSRETFRADIAALFGAGLRTFVSVLPYVVICVVCSTAIDWIANQLPARDSVAAMSLAMVLAWVPTLLLAFVLSKAFGTLFPHTKRYPRTGLRGFVVSVGKSTLAICAAQLIAAALFKPIGAFMTHGDLVFHFMFPAYMIVEPLMSCLGAVLVFAFIGTWLAADATGRNPALSDAVRRGETYFFRTAGRLLVILGSVTIVWFGLTWASAFTLHSLVPDIDVRQARHVFVAGAYLAQALGLVLGAAVIARAYAKADAGRPLEQ